MTVQLHKRIRRFALKRRDRMIRAIRLAADLCGLQLPVHDVLSVVLIDSKSMAELNQAYKGHSGPTDVLTFDYRVDTPPMGEQIAAEIVVCPDVAAAAAARYHRPFSRELFLYIIHGLLHLMGYRDGTRQERTDMQRQASRILRRTESRYALSSLFRDEAEKCVSSEPKIQRRRVAAQPDPVRKDKRS